MKIERTALTLLTLLITASSAFADVTIIRSLKLKSQREKGTIQARCATQVHGRTARRETEVITSGDLSEGFQYPVRTITWVSLDKNTVHLLEPTEPDLQKVSLNRWADYLATHHPAPDTGFRISQTWSRVIPEDETKVVRGQTCRKFTFEWRFETENPETYAKRQYGVRTTLWLTDLSPALALRLGEERAFQTDYKKRLGGMALEDLNAVTMQYAAKLVDLDKDTLFAAISQGTAHLQRIAGYPMASQTEWFLVGFKQNKTLFTVASELETLSLKRLEETAFIPAKNYVPSYDEIDVTAQLMVKNR